MMVGQAVTLNIDRPQPHDTLQLLDVKNLTVRDKNGVTKLDDVSFTVVGGEILGIAGIAGSGQKELLEAIAGCSRGQRHGRVHAADSAMPAGGLDPATIQQMGVRLSFVPEDRLGMGLVANMDMIGNMMLRSFKRASSA
jgi:ABC-type uncharacterized transport system ATPase subunit